MDKNIIELLYKKLTRKNIINHRAVNCDTTSIIFNSSSIRFDANMEKRKYIEIGKECLLKCEFIFESSSGKIIIGNNVHIGGARLISKSSIIIGDNVTMAWGITIYDHDSHSIYWQHRQHDNHNCFQDYIKNHNKVVNKDWNNVISKPIVIDDKVWIGFDVTILKGVHVGEGAVIGAKSVVTKDVPAWSLVAGNPAKIIKKNIKL